MTIQDTEVLVLFEQEARERLESLASLLLELETAGVSDRLIGSLFREAHTLKGAANVVGLSQLGAEAHALEDLFDRVRTGAVVVTPDVVDEMLTAVDRLCALTGFDEEDSDDGTDGVEATDHDQDDARADAAPASGGVRQELSLIHI